jgi:hypothetical protein
MEPTVGSLTGAPLRGHFVTCHLYLLLWSSICHVVLRPGHLLVAGGNSTTAPTAAPCPENTYNPGSNRMSSCYKCPSGLTVPEGNGTRLQSCSESLPLIHKPVTGKHSAKQRRPHSLVMVQLVSMGFVEYVA